MRVKIGPYTNWVGPYQIAEFLLTPLTWFKPKRKSKLQQAFEDGDSDAHGKLCHKFGEFLAYGSIREKEDIWKLEEDRPVTWLYKLCTWIESKKKRKIEVHIDKWDTWNMNNTLTFIILPMLKQLKETKHGGPYTNDEDVPEELRSTSAPAKENDYDVDDNHFKRWDWIMDEMIWAFEQINTDWDEQYYSGESDIYFEQVEGENVSQMKHGPNHTHKVDLDGLEKHQERMQNGFRLFGKYYQSLWD